MKILFLLALFTLASCNSTGGSSINKSDDEGVLSKDLAGYTWRKTVSCAAGCDYKAVIFYDGKAPMAYVVEYHKDSAAQDGVSSITSEASFVITPAGSLSGMLELTTDSTVSFIFSATPNANVMNICLNGVCEDYERLENGDL